MCVAHPFLPAPMCLAEEQVRGSACVWCGEQLTTGAVVDYGARPDPADPGVRWYPRACQSCAQTRSCS